MNILFAGTPDFAVPALKLLFEEHAILGVFTQPDRRSGRGKKITPPPVKVAAQELGLEVHQPSSLKDQAALIESIKPDVMIVVAYGMLLPQSILDIPKHGCINIHASLLPRWRGAAPIHRAIEAGDTESGVSIMRMELGLDTGPVYQMLKTPIAIDDTTTSLHDRLAQLGAKGVCETLRQINQNPSLIPTPQNDELACYAKKILKTEANIDWSLSATEIQQKIRAFIPFPVAQCHHNETRIRVWRASVADGQKMGDEIGKVISVSDEGAIIQCGKGSLLLQELQRDGSKALSWREFANGYQIGAADTLA